MSVEESLNAAERKAFATWKFETIDMLVADARISPFARLTGIAFLQFLNRRTFEAWPSKRTLALTLGQNERSVRPWLRELEVAGYLTKGEQRRGGPMVRRMKQPVTPDEARNWIADRRDAVQVEGEKAVDEAASSISTLALKAMEGSLTNDPSKPGGVADERPGGSLSSVSEGSLTNDPNTVRGTTFREHVQVAATKKEVTDSSPDPEEESPLTSQANEPEVVPQGALGVSDEPGASDDDVEMRRLVRELLDEGWPVARAISLAVERLERRKSNATA